MGAKQVSTCFILVTVNWLEFGEPIRNGGPGLLPPPDATLSTYIYDCGAVHTLIISGRW